MKSLSYGAPETFKFSMRISTKHSSATRAPDNFSSKRGIKLDASVLFRELPKADRECVPTPIPALSKLRMWDIAASSPKGCVACR